MNQQYTLELGQIAKENGPNMPFYITQYEQEDCSRHNHHFFEFVYITNGTAMHTVNGESRLLSKGDYFVIDYGSCHSYMESKELRLINCLFMPELVDETLKGCDSFEQLMHSCLMRYYKPFDGKTSGNQIYYDADQSVLQNLTAMLTEFQKKKLGYMELCRTRLLEVLILTMRNIVDQKLLREESQAVTDLTNYIHNHYQSQRILKEFCKEYHFCEPYISRRLHQETGSTITSYLQKVRMDKCCKLLAGSDFTITEIAQKVGYHDPKFFNQLFRRMIKMSPREYRKMERGIV